MVYIGSWRQAKLAREPQRKKPTFGYRHEKTRTLLSSNSRIIPFIRLIAATTFQLRTSIRSIEVAPWIRTMRIHMATFDSADGKEYNEENCALVRDLILTLPNVAVAYWCERDYVSDAK